MSSHRVKTLLVLGAASAILFAYASITIAEPEKAAEPQTELEKAAKQAYLATVVAFENDVATLDDIYRWSRRLMKVEIRANRDRKKAILDHVSRMRPLNERAIALFQAGARGGSAENVYATTYYVEEAKLDLFPSTTSSKQP